MSAFSTPSSFPPFGGLSAANPRYELRIGGAVIVAFLAGAIGWAGLAPLDSAVVAPALVKVSGERQKVQPLHEGIVSALHVAEGDYVLIDRVHQLLVIASGQIGSTDRSGKQAITDEHGFLRLFGEHDVAFRVTGTMADAEF